MKRGIVGFYTLSSFTLAIADLPPEYAKHLPRYDLIPSALIGRLARDQKVRGQGVRRSFARRRGSQGDWRSRSLAVFAIVVEATDEKAASLLSRLWICTISEPPLRLFMPNDRSGGGYFLARCLDSLRLLIPRRIRKGRHDGSPSPQRQRAKTNQINKQSTAATTSTKAPISRRAYHFRVLI